VFVAVPASLDTVTLAIEVAFDAIPASVQMAIDAVAPAIQPLGQAVPAGILGTIGGAIQSPVDTAALAIQVPVDDLAPVVQKGVDAFPVGRGLCDARPGQQHAGTQCNNQFLLVHHLSPWPMWPISGQARSARLILFNAADRRALTTEPEKRMAWPEQGTATFTLTSRWQAG